MVSRRPDVGDVGHRKGGAAMSADPAESVVGPASSRPVTTPRSATPTAGAELTVPAVAHAFTIIDMLARGAGPRRLADVVAETGLPKTTVYRLLKQLAALGVLSQDDRGYELGSRLVRYGNASVPHHIDLIGVFYALISGVHDQLDETVQLGILNPPDVTFVAFVDSSQPVRLATRVGRRLPAHASATGKAILAFSPPELVSQLVTTGLKGLTEWTVTDQATLNSQLEQTYARGWAVEYQESTRNLSCVAAPVLDTTGRAIAAVTACLPVPVLSADRQRHLGAALSRFAGDLSRRLGH